ncbi:hypothetical protein LCGC14_2293340 [marine sediment metagenome]|uniref:Uncharacterized protein n=1 Tax=marine sediment metagenome TaxID=412755 RepID=A0A0F9DD59_9ZZZZ
MADFTKPTEMSDLDLAFPANALDYMPPMGDIPEEFTFNAGSKWNRFISDWFFLGLEERTMLPKEGIDEDIALRHIGMILGSFQPKHEHKEAAAAYLLSLWFEDVKWKARKVRTWRGRSNG